MARCSFQHLVFKARRHAAAASPQLAQSAQLPSPVFLPVLTPTLECDEAQSSTKAYIKSMKFGEPPPVRRCAKPPREAVDYQDYPRVTLYQIILLGSARLRRPRSSRTCWIPARVLPCNLRRSMRSSATVWITQHSVRSPDVSRPSSISL